MKEYVPWLTFIAGLSGGLHCVGMCGGLVTASCAGSRDVWRYQVGRLFGYLSAGLASGLVGGLLGDYISPGLGPILMGSMFILWGLKSLVKIKTTLGPQRLLNKMYFKLWGRFVQTSSGPLRSLLTGLFSVLLPCGLLYGVVIGGIALQDKWLAVFSMLTFWLGTLPAMVFAPEIFRKILAPFRKRFPTSYALGLILIGLVTLGFRAMPHVKTDTSRPVHSELSCH